MRVSINRLTVFVAVLALAPMAFAQTADDVIAKNLQAKGGVDLLKQTTSVRTVATASTPNGEVTITSVSRRPNLMRNEISGAGQNLVIGFDGTTAWVAPQGRPAPANCRSSRPLIDRRALACREPP